MTRKNGAETEEQAARDTKGCFGPGGTPQARQLGFYGQL